MIHQLRLAPHYIVRNFLSNTKWSRSGRAFSRALPSLMIESLYGAHWSWRLVVARAADEALWPEGHQVEIFCTFFSTPASHD